MLVLTRKKEEKIQIGKDITITILKVKGRSVQIGIEAPGEVRILRGEFVGEAERDASKEGSGDRCSSRLVGETGPEGGDREGPGPKPREVNIGTGGNDSASGETHSFPPKSAARRDRLGCIRADEFLPCRLRRAWPKSLG